MVQSMSPLFPYPRGSSVIRFALPSVALALLLAGCTPVPTEVEVTPEPTTAGAITCTDAAAEEVDLSGATWQHPRNSFYEGTEEDIPTEADLEHLLRADNALVVIYDQENLPAAAIEPLRDWIYMETAAVAIPSTDDPRAAIEVRYGGTVKLCDGVDTIQLAEFSATRPFGSVEEHDESGSGLEGIEPEVGPTTGPR